MNFLLDTHIWIWTLVEPDRLSRPVQSALTAVNARRWLSPLTIYGMNALFLFALSGLVARMLGAVRIARDDGPAVSLKAWLFAPLARLPIDPALSSLAFAILFDLAMFAVAWWMWKKRWFVRV